MATGPDSAVVPPPPPPPAAAPAPDSSEAPRWPLWLPLAAIAGGLAFGLMGVVILSGILRAAGVDSKGDSPGLTAAGTAIVDLAVVGACVMLAATVARPRAWHFGLRPAPLGFTAAIAGIGVLSFSLFTVIYGVIAQPKSEQKVVDNLGADTNTALLIAGALVVIVVAPVCEELFFRGFLFRVLRLRLPFWFAAVVDGVVFGIVHGTSTPISALPILAALGIVFCWVYERTGTLFATIALHALNNTVSYGANTDSGWVAALIVGAVMIAACVFAVSRSPRGAPASAPS
jgi:membrane protease YdiL (CAAX protease family)